jgi:hypothetical protein
VTSEDSGFSSVDEAWNYANAFTLDADVSLTIYSSDGKMIAFGQI